MGKKIDETEVKKECPSCGLGVPMDTRVCEFCGWDFEEEDEWILQIEKLERDLLVEKTRFAPGSVEEKIESTLHSPTGRLAEIQRSRASEEPRNEPRQEREQVQVVEQTPARRQRPTVSFDDVIEPERARPEGEEAEPERQVRAPPSVPDKPRVRRVRTAKPKQEIPQPQPQEAGPQRKTRVVRKVKSR